MTALFDSDFLARCRYLDQTARRNWGARFLGRRVDTRAAGGSEFVGHSDYTSGDDFRYIDWPICARLDELLTRQYRGSEDRVVYLLLDASAGMSLGDPPKFDVARRLLATLGYIAMANDDRVGVVSISDRILSEMPPLRGTRHAPRLFRYLERQSPDSAPIRLQRCVEAFVRERPRRGLTVVASDLFDPAGFEPAVDLLAKRGFPPYLVQIVSPEESAPQLGGNITLVEAGSGRRRGTYFEPLDQTNYRRVFAEFSESCRRYCDRRSIGLIQTDTVTPVAESVQRMIRTCTSRMLAR